MNKKLLITGILLTSLLLGCGTGNSDTFVRFHVEGQSYEVKNPSFMATRIKGKIHLMDLTHDPMSSVPGATIQWRMNLESMDQLVGQNLDLNAIDLVDGPIAVFALTEDLSAQGQQHSPMHFKIDRLEEGIIEGSFSGKNFTHVSMTKEGVREVDVTAQFRVKLNQI